MKKFMSNAIISIAGIIVGYFAISLPFHLFEQLTSIQMRIIFVSEIIIYFAIFSAFFLIKEHKENCRKREEEYQNIRRKNKTLDEIKIINFDFAA